MASTSRPPEPADLATTRTFYDAIAADYDARFRDQWGRQPLDRAVLDAFAELVRTGGGPVIDVGCGAGHIAAHLHGRGLDVRGVDLSPGMLALAREAHPGLRFDEGTMTALDAADGSLGGILAWYSLIHTPPERLPRVFAEFHRALAPGGQLLLAFQVGDEPLHLAEPFGRPVSLDFRRLRPERVAELLAEAGFAVHARLVRAAEEWERVPQAHVMARKPDAA